MTATDHRGSGQPQPSLSGKRIAILAADGVEQVELERPRAAVIDAGAEVDLVSITTDPIQAMNQDIEPGDQFTPDKAVANADAADYAALILPGGTVSPDKLRVDASAIAFVQAFFEAGKPVGAICHGPWTLVEADLVRGRTLTSFPSIRTDISNAGSIVVDEQVVTDQGLVTSRDPDDLDAFCATIVGEFAQHAHAGLTDPKTTG